MIANSSAMLRYRPKSCIIDESTISRFAMTSLIAYHDTPIMQDLPSSAELFLNRRIHSRLGIMYQPTTLTDKEKDRLFQQRSGHLSSSQESLDEYLPHQLVWFTEDGSHEWKPGFVKSKAPYPDSYWIITANNERHLRRNSHDLKPRTAPLSYRPPTITLPKDPPTSVISQGNLYTCTKKSKL